MLPPAVMHVCSHRESNGGANPPQLSPAPSEAPSPKTRKRFSASDDLLFARQMHADVPYRAGRGRAMKAWAAMGRLLAATPGFQFVNPTAKACHSRFKTLLETHRERKAAGSSTNERDASEKTQLLDALLEDYEGFLAQPKPPVGLGIAQSSAQRLSKRPRESRQQEDAEESDESSGGEEDTSVTPPATASRHKRRKTQEDDGDIRFVLIEALRQQSESQASMFKLLQADMAMRQKQFEEKMLERREERRREFEERKLLLEMENRKLMQFMATMLQQLNKEDEADSAGL
ncbi:hypothetical protein BBJ28_00025146 [Nothophytophthora sp. Chile5]|nr:hypothetical protein BBJ28_00025146 [Nothophytophthora sp. Chile5]